MAGLPHLQVTIHFKSGFSIGSGFGLAGVRDVIVMRDSKGLPYVPATSLKGVIRQACEELSMLLNKPVFHRAVDELKAISAAAAKLDRHKGNANLSPLTQIFGSSWAPGLFDFGSARLKLKSNLIAPVSRGATWTEPHNSINASTGTARADHLLALEIASGDLGIPEYLFRFSIEPLSPDIAEPLISLLICSIRFAERLGSGKSRGKGVVEMVIDEPYLGKTTEEWVRLTFGEG
jgi:CRISPR-associated protein Csx10